MKRQIKRFVRRQVRAYGYYWLTGAIVTALVGGGLGNKSWYMYHLVRSLLRAIGRAF